MTPRRPTLLALGVVAALTMAACSSGKSALDSGSDADSTDAPAGTDAPESTTDDGTPATTLPATTTTIPLSDLPACPTDALDAEDGTVDIVFWHAMANDLDPELIALTDAYNASQDRVHVELQNQIGYDSVIDKYIAASSSSRPTLVQLPEYALQEFADSGTFVPTSSCIEASGYDTDPILPRALGAYQLEGVQWGMPFNVSNPVLFYNRKMFVEAGLDPDVPPVSLEQLQAAAQAIVDSGAASAGLVLDSGADSGGGWFLEQWFGRSGELYADNGNGRLARATEVLYDNELGAELLTFLQGMIDDGLAVNVGDNASGTDSLLKLADQTAPAAMVMYTSAALGTVFNALGGGAIPGLTAEDVGVGPMPGPGETPAVQVGGASLWIAGDKSDAETAAAWDFITYLTSAETQSTWAAGTGYVPIRADATMIEPLVTKYADDPRYKVAYDQLVSGQNDVVNNSPALGPLREVRAETANAVATVFNGGDAAEALAAAAEASNALIRSYNERN
ncbi:MAG: ABC transporter substrate-binding protein [Ilumatobacteraceae bacterium]